MKVSFEFSVTDLAEVAERAHSNSRVVSGWRLQSKIYWAALVGILLYAISQGPALKRALFSLTVAAGLAFYLHRRPQPAIDQRTAQYLREQLGGEGPFLCEVEIDPTGLTTRQLGHESRHAWPHIQSVSEVNGNIEFIYKPAGRLLVRERAFASPQARTSFLDLARSLMNSAQT